MKRHFLFIAGLLFSMQVIAQTGIGTTTPHASAKLDVSATDKGFLPPRVTLTNITDASTIASPATGLLVYNTGDNNGFTAGYYYWNGGSWATIATSGGSGSFAASFLRGSRVSSQSIDVNGVVSFSQIDASSGSNISLNTSTGQITLVAGFTYRLIASIPGFIGSRPNFRWYNETTSTYFGSGISGYAANDAAGNGSFGGLSEIVFTPNSTTIVSYRLSSATSASVTIGGNADFTLEGSYPWFDIEVISGNSPMTVINFGDIKSGFQSGDHSGWVKLDGRAKSTLSATQQAQATALGIGTNLPDATNAFLVQNGTTLGILSSSNTKTITQSNLPNVSFMGNTNDAGAHTHTGTVPGVFTASGNNSGGSFPPGNNYNFKYGTLDINQSGSHSHTVTVSSGGSGAALDITPRSLSVNTFI